MLNILYDFKMHLHSSFHAFHRLIPFLFQWRSLLPYALKYRETYHISMCYLHQPRLKLQPRSSQSPRCPVHLPHTFHCQLRSHQHNLCTYPPIHTSCTPMGNSNRCSENRLHTSHRHSHTLCLLSF